MTDDPLDQVLRLVSEGRLSAEEAAPILAALDDAGAGSTGRQAAGRSGQGAGPGAGTRSDEESTPGSRHATSLRIEVTEHGRRVVNLRLPIGVGRFALDRVPGLSGDQVDRVREALRSGLSGPVLEVNDEDDAVRIVLE
jgi:hypothetical protein